MASAGAAVIFWLIVRTGAAGAPAGGARRALSRRVKAGAWWFVASLLFGVLRDDDWIPAFRNNFNRELAKNGLWPRNATGSRSAPSSAKGYDTAFIYGGFGYCDNMNHYFGHNGYRVIDRNSVAKDEIFLANAWARATRRSAIIKRPASSTRSNGIARCVRPSSSKGSR